MPTDFDALRASQFSRLDAASPPHAYLDYTGSGLYPQSILHHHQTLLRTHCLGNPHSSNPTSAVSTAKIDAARRAVLRYFNADPAEYCLVFTPNASAAIKLVAEAFPFTPRSALLLLADNHNSVNGIRVYACRAAASTTYIPLASAMRCPPLAPYLHKRNTDANNLFAFPAQSNFSGVKHDLAAVRAAHRHAWYVLLDAAAFVPTSKLDLSVVRPDFVPVSFYKIFGLPTGVGALIAKKKSLAVLKRPWFAGGTVKYASVKNNVHSLCTDESAFEEGTVNFLSIPAITFGIQFISRIGIDNINARVHALTTTLLRGMLALKYTNGAPMLTIYGPHTMKDRGGTIAFDVLTPTASRVDARHIEKAANKQNISLRTGCFCNPGAAETALKAHASRTSKCVHLIPNTDLSLEHVSKCVGEYLGAIRVSVGIATSEQDISTFLSFLRKFCSKFQGGRGGIKNAADINSGIIKLVLDDVRDSRKKHRHHHLSSQS
ncbi:unnamed protein product [Chondrus crispus]|uniref:Aminotransferase class V domain-containing protein n=1 Tax=Chondrus crispus TaxID=2769 RepID=R7QGL8_CHOCR|nr:unnamed protein product [Chondrus crispus]CDF37234.1 unnamed protein product [Chondrus crispus]|eukprot:XP_005717053.1 unnamed protein product [Chondrus crispus]